MISTIRFVNWASLLISLRLHGGAVSCRKIIARWGMTAWHGLLTSTGWPRPMRCLIFAGLFPQMSPWINCCQNFGKKLANKTWYEYNPVCFVSCLRDARPWCEWRSLVKTSYSLCKKSIIFVSPQKEPTLEDFKSPSNVTWGVLRLSAYNFQKETCSTVKQIGICRCAAVLYTQVPKKCTDLAFQYTLISETYIANLHGKLIS